jgi:hypothetical protein
MLRRCCRDHDERTADDSLRVDEEDRSTTLKEAQFQSKLLKALRSDTVMRDAIIWKVSDRFSGGRPDLQVICRNITTYFELKVGANELSSLQQYYLHRINRAYVIRVLEDSKKFQWKLYTKWKLYTISNSSGLIEGLNTMQELVNAVIRICVNG